MSRERIYMRVDKGVLVPADNHARGLLRQYGLKVGDLVSVDIRKPRNPKFHRLVHQIGVLVANNIEAFAGMGAHEVIKRLQLESGTFCKQEMIEIPNLGLVSVRTPESISFASLDETQFQEFALAICRHISARYWPECSAEQIEEMAEAMIDE